MTDLMSAVVSADGPTLLPEGERCWDAFYEFSGEFLFVGNPKTKLSAVYALYSY